MTAQDARQLTKYAKETKVEYEKIEKRIREEAQKGLSGAYVGFISSYVKERLKQDGFEFESELSEDGHTVYTVKW